MKDLSKKICLLRALKNKTQEGVAKELGLSTTVYQGIEKDASSIAVDRLKSIVAYHGLTMEEFFSITVNDIADFIKGKTPALLKREFCPQLIEKLESMTKLLSILVKNSIMLIQKPQGQQGS